MKLVEQIEKLIVDPQSFTKNVQFPDVGKIRLYDETLRDGEQMPGICFTADQKLEIAKRIADIGVHIMCVGFPAASLSDQKALQLIIQAKQCGEMKPVEIVVLCRCNYEDIDKTLQALKDIDASPSEITLALFTCASDLHMKYKIGKTLLKREGRNESEWESLPIEFYRDANIRFQTDAIRYALSRGVTTIEFGAEDISRANGDYCVRYFRAGIEAGASRAAWADTVGCLTPESTRWYASRLVNAVPENIPINSHFHNDCGLATINAITALSCGASVVSVTVNGYGERAGNVKLHEFVIALRLLYGLELPAFQYHKLRDLSRFLEQMTGSPMQQHEPIIGTRVFTHESGIHTHAMLIDHRMYEAIPAALVGATTDWVYGKHSGTSFVMNALQKHHLTLEAAGIKLTPHLARAVTEEIKRIREERASKNQSMEILNIHQAAVNQLPIVESEVLTIARRLAPLPSCPGQSSISPEGTPIAPPTLLT